MVSAARPRKVTFEVMGPEAAPSYLGPNLTFFKVNFSIGSPAPHPLGTSGSIPGTVFESDTLAVGGIAVDPLLGSYKGFSTPPSGKRVQNWPVRTSLEFYSLWPYVKRPTLSICHSSIRSPYEKLKL